MSFLTQREHSRSELTTKLTKRGFDVDDIELVLDKLQALNWQSDARFCERYITSRCERGFGPVRIIQELKQRGIDRALIEQEMEAAGIDWQVWVKRAWMKKSANLEESDEVQRKKLVQHLQYKGFALDDIKKVLNKTLKLNE